jgi:hypothetical protein
MWMVVGMYGRAVGREEMPKRASRELAQLFTPPALRAFWGLSVAGELRHFAKDVGKPLPVASQRSVRVSSRERRPDWSPRWIVGISWSPTAPSR